MGDLGDLTVLLRGVEYDLAKKVYAFLFEALYEVLEGKDIEFYVQEDVDYDLPHVKGLLLATILRSDMLPDFSMQDGIARLEIAPIAPIAPNPKTPAAGSHVLFHIDPTTESFSEAQVDMLRDAWFSVYRGLRAFLDQSKSHIPRL
ncbi:MAG: hypothetical protein ACO38I_03940 [Ilumatobacteraceae bacterium]